MYFNPRSRVGTDTVGCVSSYLLHISIHVPAWGTTKPPFFHKTINLYFNPRSRVGNDTFAGLGSGYYVVISIHVPAWGTTKLTDIVNASPYYFNPRSRVGNDRKISVIHDAFYQFQSTFPRGERLRIAIPPYYSRTFQSTFPRGERQ